MRIGAAIVALLSVCLTTACGGRVFQQYEYEEEMYLALDGSATVYVNSSLAALNALRGSAFATSPNELVDRDAVREFFTTPLTPVSGSVRASRRSNRRFVRVRVDVADIRRLGEAAPFGWSAYRFAREGDLLVYRQTVGASAGRTVTTNWTGQERVAFRIHVPSKVVWHDGGAELRRGNILVWDQSLTDRLQGKSLEIEARIETQSILYRTLWLFAATFAAVVLMFGVVIWWIVRRGGKQQA